MARELTQESKDNRHMVFKTFDNWLMDSGCYEEDGYENDGDTWFNLGRDVGHALFTKKSYSIIPFHMLVMSVNWSCVDSMDMVSLNSAWDELVQNLMNKGFEFNETV